MSQYDDRYGSLAIASWFSAMLFSLVLTEAWKYFTSPRQDKMYRKLLAVWIVVLDAVGLAAGFASVYIYCVKYWGNIDAANKQYWPFWLSVISDGVICLFVDVFLVHRYYSLSRNPFVSIFLILVSFLAFGAMINDMVVFTNYNTYDTRSNVQWSASLWLISACVADAAIALALLWEFRSMKTSFKETRSLLRRLMLRTIQTGAATTACAALVLITFLTNNTSNTPIAFVMILGHLYSLTLFYNLNVRDTAAENSRSRHKTSSRSGTTDQRPEFAVHQHSVTMDGIHVHRTAVVHVDKASDHSEAPAYAMTDFSNRDDPERGTMKATVL